MLNHGQVEAQGDLSDLQDQMNKQDADLSDIYLEMTQGESANE